ncbi:TPA: UMP kinase [Candidatus Micrarchaeota archaeon]|nr:UMP kinase [Candidatus Micrarchaeota archaeon]
MITVLSVGGSLINKENGIDTEFLKGIAKILKADDRQFGIVTGGGWTARQTANSVRAKGGSEFEADEEAIKETWKNAKLLVDALRAAKINVYPKVAKDFTEAGNAAKPGKYKIVVMGGTIPGITTDTDSVLLAEKLGAKRLINISNVDAIYDSNPKTNPNARKFDRMTYDELIALANSSDKRTAGTNFVFDMLACKLAARSKIELFFIGGQEANVLNEIKNAIEGTRIKGTVVGEANYNQTPEASS